MAYKNLSYVPIYKVACCKHCNKKEELGRAHEEWFIVNCAVAYCTESCFLIEGDNE